MKGRSLLLGFLTDCLPDWSLERVAGWAAGNGFEALEIAAWPDLPGQGHASHVPVASLDTATAERTATLLAERGLTCSSLAYYANLLHPEPSARLSAREHLRRCIDAAALLGCPTVGTFVGRDPGRTVDENLAEAEVLFRPLVDQAGQRGVTLVIENCLMDNWHPDGYPGNLAYSPELWDWLIDLGLRLNFDPSHLPPLGIDPVGAARRYAPWIALVQAKDVEVSPEARDRYGWPGPARSRRPGDHGWFRFCPVGQGQVDWRGLMNALAAQGYAGVVSVEHKDMRDAGDDDGVLAGLRQARDTLRPLLG
jgi:sugar phosphate isomerase/epimerase